MAEREDLVDEVIDLPMNPVEIENTDDGGAIINLDNETEIKKSPEFYSNLAEELDESFLTKLGIELWDLIEDDRRAREKRVEKYAQALKETGVGDAQSGGANFADAARVSHPMVLRAVVEFQASAIKELFPVGGLENGPVKHQIITDKPSKGQVEKAKRKSRYMNWQLTKQDAGFRGTLEELIGQMALAGGQYLKIYHDRRLGKNVSMFIGLDKLHYPAAAPNFYSAERYTHEQAVTGAEFRRRMESGFYRKVDVGTPVLDDGGPVDEAARQAAGVDQSVENVDEERVVYECYVDYEIEPEHEKGACPYICTIDKESRKVLAIYRNWKENDPDYERIDHIAEWAFLYWKGMPVGLDQMIGSLSEAATGALRALLDSAHLSNFAGALKLKGGGEGGSDISINPGQIVEVPGASGLTDPDIRKLVMPMPFPQPSPVLMELLGFLTDQGMQVTMSSLEKMSEGRQDIPVGTAMALFEHGSRIYSAIFARMHAAMERTLKIIHTLNAMYLEEEDIVREIGDLIVRRDDFEGPMDVAPVSDPLIYSELQRAKQMEFVAQRAMTMPMIYNLREVEKRLLRSAKINDIDEIMVPQPEPKRLNPINENLAASLGQPVVAFPDQDHFAHLKGHLEYLLHPMFGMNPAIQGAILPILVNHIKEHVLYLYAAETVRIATDAAEGTDIVELMDEDPDIANAFDAMIVDAQSNFLSGPAYSVFDQLMPPPAPQIPATNPQTGEPVLDPATGQPQMQPLAMQSPFFQMLQQMMQMVQAMQPPPPMDPAQVQAQKVQQDGQIKREEMGQKAQDSAQERALKQADLAQRARETDAKNAQTEVERMEETRLEEQRLSEEQRQHDDNINVEIAGQVSKERMNTADNETAMWIAEGEWENNEDVGVSTGTGINPGGR